MALEGGEGSASRPGLSLLPRKDLVPIYKLCHLKIIVAVQYLCTSGAKLVNWKSYFTVLMINVTINCYCRPLYVWSVSHVVSAGAPWMLSVCYFSNLEVSDFCAGVYVTIL
jgi:hypothetical protein